MRAGPAPASANSLTGATTRPPPGTDLSPLQTVFSCSIQPLDPRNSKVALGAKTEAAEYSDELPLSADSRPSRAAQGAGVGPQSARSGGAGKRRRIHPFTKAAVPR